MQRPRVIRIAATLVAGASVFAPVPAAAQSALDPGELRPSVSGQSDGTELGQASGPSPGPPGSSGLLGLPLYAEVAGHFWRKSLIENRNGFQTRYLYPSKCHFLA